jgi:sigma-B regulation protein RsbU (phosphoserine phosphatase)
LLFRTLPGRLTLAASAVWGAITLGRQVADLPLFLDLVGRTAGVAWLIGLAGLATVAIARTRRAFLWRVRRKLLLSYVFLGVVPVVLVLAFALATGVLLYVTVASYVFQQGYEAELEDVRRIADVTATEVGRASADAAGVIARRVENLSDLYPSLSLAVVTLRTPGSGPNNRSVPATAGPWMHGSVPVSMPGWLATATSFSGTLLGPAESDRAPRLVLRAMATTADRRYAVIADLPTDETVVARLAARTGATLGATSVEGCGANLAMAEDPGRSSGWVLFRETVAFIDCTAWDSGARGRVSLRLQVPVGGLYSRLAAANASTLSWSGLVNLLVVLAVLLLIIQASALVMGALLARSITSAVHELFDGTERVQHGDFAHRIKIESRDQLGELAVSFNRMSASVEHLLHVQREKQRLDDELRIAREIQKSLLPKRPPEMAGLDIADLCEPAREVGGDYYDFFAVGPRQLAVLIADVAGKGTSAALYMAELKGLMLALSQSAPSPRQLLIDVNRRLSGHLGARSFITMTYAVIDLERRTLTVARAGHTPLILVRRGEVSLAQPEGMVLGLQIPGADLKFEAMLAEHRQEIEAGDLLVFYTDGISEAMDSRGELFGDEALARLVASQQDQPAAGVRERVLRDVRAYVGEADQHDDMTMVVVKVGEAAA